MSTVVVVVVAAVLLVAVLEEEEEEEERKKERKKERKNRYLVWDKNVFHVMQKIMYLKWGRKMKIPAMQGLPVHPGSHRHVLGKMQVP